jgi:anti-anti-sigma factor
MMLSRQHNPWLEVAQVYDVTVVTFTCRAILNEPDIEAIGERLVSLVADGCTKIVLNLGTVNRTSSSMIGKLVALQQKIRAAHGRLVLCGLQPEIAQVFQILQLRPLFMICETERQALDSF